VSNEEPPNSWLFFTEAAVGKKAAPGAPGTRTKIFFEQKKMKEHKTRGDCTPIGERKDQNFESRVPSRGLVESLS